MEHRIQDQPYSATERDRIKDEAADAADTLSDKARQAADKAGDIAQQTAQKAEDAVDTAKQKAEELVDTAKQKSSELGTTATDKVESAMSATGSQMSSFARTVRDSAPAEGKPAELAANAADALERGGAYLQEADLTMVRSDLERVIREHPLEAMLVGLGVGYLLARATRR